jgi:hypothetical protein
MDSGGLTDLGAFASFLTEQLSEFYSFSNSQQTVN